MDEMKYEKYDVKLSNGREIKGAEQLGSIYRTSERLTREYFAGGLGRVEIRRSADPESEVTELSHCEIALLRDEAGGGSEFWLRELSDEKLRQLQTEGNIEYLAMMTGVEL